MIANIRFFIEERKGDEIKTAERLLRAHSAVD
jgi:hypothetical protein